ncbi:MAG: ribosomal RNA small subunit methyltransferase A [Candidatus Gastranaerophilales bacterium]|nr:ribosomal RNA small subunit methyltransferase A [Candidatus Gastranaerophilales bacterium]
MNYLERAKRFRTKKRLGQNFLVDNAVIDRIIEAASISPDDTVIEIGAGAGFVTEKLAQKAKRVIAIELDEDAVAELKKLPFDNLEVVHRDILKTNFSDIVDSPVKVVANIPYYITSPILAHLLGEIDQPEWKNRELISEIVLMVQYEVAKRIVANENSPAKEYGLLSILVNYWCETEFICKVKAGSFYPAPKVDSALVRLVIRKEPTIKTDNPALFKKITKAAFGTRRKNIKNALTSGGFEQEKVSYALQKLGIDPNTRGEKLSMADYARLADILY